MKRYCQVVVDLTSESVDRAFTYCVEGETPIEPGWRVLAPFGPRRVEGIVIGVSDDPGDVPAERVRPIAGILDSFGAILPEMLDLARWMRETYHCTLASALRLMIPAQMRGARIREKTVRAASALVSGKSLEEALAGLSRAPVQRKILLRLSAGEIPVASLAEDFPGAQSALAALVRKGLARVDSREQLRAPRISIDVRRAVAPVLTRAQRAAADALTAAIDGGGGAFLLFGVTGSGKTEVYIHAVRHALDAGRGAIVLVPEIALTPQMVDWFRARFGGDAAVLHSRLSAGERYDEWRRIRTGQARVVVGARSAVFAPVENLGILIVDEEHESTYRSDRHPRYDARDVARRRCEEAGAALVLGSATPSIGSFMKTMNGVRPENRMTLLELDRRINGRPLPEVSIVDMSQELARGNRTMFSAAARKALGDCLNRNEQAILLMNRRGYATFVSCRACGYVEKCENCDVSMTYHIEGNRLKCHYCDQEREPPRRCPQCGSSFIKYFGSGTQKVEQELLQILPRARVLRMDADTTRRKDAHERILAAFRNREADVLVGTQMIAKGLDFPDVTLVCVMAADTSLNLPDYRSQERTFQLITQVAGRAGRAEKNGQVIVQTYQPQAYAIRLAARQDYRAFYQAEAQYRRRGLYPPFTVLARLLVAGRDGEAVQRAALELESALGRRLDEYDLRQSVVQMRALEAPIAHLRGEARWQVFVKAYARGKMDLILSHMEELAREDRGGVRVELEVNPTNMF